MKVDLSNGAGAGISTLVKITGTRDGESTPPPLHTLSFDGNIGSLDLRGVPTCRPTARSAQTSGCKTPQIGEGGGYAVRRRPEEDRSLKLAGALKIYSGGQRGAVSKLWAWAVFPPDGRSDVTRTFVIPMTLTRRGPARSELRATLPQAKEELFSLTELRLSIRRSVSVKGRSIPLTSVRCPVGAGAKVLAEATFYDIGASAPVDATVSPTCAGR